MAKVAPDDGIEIVSHPNGDSAEAGTRSETPESPTKVLSRASSVRRNSTERRYSEFAPKMKTASTTFLRIPFSDHGPAIVWQCIACIAMQLLFAAPYSANENREAGSSEGRTILRGLIGGIGCLSFLGPILMIISPILVRGGWHKRYLLCIPMQLTIAIGVAFIPADGSTLGVVSITLVTFIFSYICSIVSLNVPLYSTHEHKKLNLSLGPPIMFVGSMFFGLLIAYIWANRQTDNPATGLILPIGCRITTLTFIKMLERSIRLRYYEPKKAFIDWAQSEEGIEFADTTIPPLLGDIEGSYGFIVAMCARLIGNAPFAGTIVSVMLTPNSYSWVIGLAVSFVLDFLDRTFYMQALQRPILARFGKADKARCNALEDAYSIAQGGSMYIAPFMALCIGAYRAAVFQNPRAIVWLDVNDKVCWLLLAQTVSELIMDIAIKLRSHFKLTYVCPSVRFEEGHTLCNDYTKTRMFETKGYIFASFCSVGIVYSVFIAFLGPGFATGQCENFDPLTSDTFRYVKLNCSAIPAPAT